MKGLFAALLLCLVVAAPVHADGDSWARFKVREHDEQLTAMRAQISALKTLVSELRQDNAKLRKRIDQNYELIQQIVSTMARQSKTQDETMSDTSDQAQ